MAIPWPEWLPECANTWEESDQPVVIRTQMDLGQPKVRRRYTHPLRGIRLSFVSDHETAMALRTFFELDLEGGVQEHEFVHPFTGALENFRFTKPPVISNFNALACTIACEWEQL